MSRPADPAGFDPALDGPPDPDSGFFGEGTPLEQARVVLITAPFEATVSYRTGTASGPEAIRRASHQVDFADPWVGDLRAHGWAWEVFGDDVKKLSDEARPAAERVIAALEQGRAGAPEDLRLVEEAYLAFAQPAQQLVKSTLEAGRRPIVVGGDHSVALPGLLAAFEHDPEVGVLHVDAHADLRLAYEGFRYSHASVLRNLLEEHPAARVVQVGLRDVSAEELALIEAREGLRAVFDRALTHARLEGRVPGLLDAIVAALPPRVWITLDVDGLDPALCPGTGTPVPGGLTWDEISLLLSKVTAAREVIGADLVEVSPGDPAPEDDTWDAIVGARLLYRLIGAVTGSPEPALPGALSPPRPAASR